MTTRSGFLLAVFALSIVHSNSLRLIGRSPLNSQVEQRSDTEDNRQGFIWNIYRRFAGTTDSPFQNNNKDIYPEQNDKESVDDNDSVNNDSDIEKDYDHDNKNDQELEEISSTTTTTIAPPQISYASPYYPYKSQLPSHTQPIFSNPAYYPSPSLPNSYTQSIYKPIYGDIYSKPPPPLPPLINITYSPVLAPATDSSSETTSVTDPIISSKNVRAELADLVLKSLRQNSDIQAAFNPLQSYQNPFSRSPSFVQNASPSKFYKTLNSGPFVITSNDGSYDDVSDNQQKEDEQQYYVVIPLTLIQNAFENDEDADDSQQKYYVPSRKSYRLNKKHQSNVKTSRPLKGRKQKRKYTGGGKKRKSSSQRRRKHRNKLSTSSSADDELLYITVDDANPTSNGEQFVNDINKY